MKKYANSRSYIMLIYVLGYKAKAEAERLNGCLCISET
jgi:hypothetical protein